VCVNCLDHSNITFWATSARASLAVLNGVGVGIGPSRGNYDSLVFINGSYYAETETSGPASITATATSAMQLNNLTIVNGSFTTHGSLEMGSGEADHFNSTVAHMLIYNGTFRGCTGRGLVPDRLLLLTGRRRCGI
jgi:hypothetical protein